MSEQEDEVWDAKKLASFLGYSEETVRGYSTSKPKRLPPRLEGIRRPLWSKAAVMKWLAERSGMPEAPAPKRPVDVEGNPTIMDAAPGFTVLVADKQTKDAEAPKPVSVKMRKGRPRRPPP